MNHLANNVNKVWRDRELNSGIKSSALLQNYSYCTVTCYFPLYVS